MRIITWNINGLRSLGPKEDFNRRLLDLNADVICVQETKVTRDMLEATYAMLPDFISYFAFSRKRMGYSGVATFSKARAARAEEGLTGTLPSAREVDAVGAAEGLSEEFSQEELRQLDSEGRCVITMHHTEEKQTVVIINVYCPRVDPENTRREGFKLKFYKLLNIRAHKLKEAGHHVIIVGDLNTSHRVIDHCDPSEDFHASTSRQWFDNFLQPYWKDVKQLEVFKEDSMSEWKTRVLQVEPHLFVDSFRHFHPTRTSAFTCWNTQNNCRLSNYGTRLDYIFISTDLIPSLKSCDIHPEIEGSDHCPVSAEFAWTMLSSDKSPMQIYGKQKTLTHFLAAKKSEFIVGGKQTKPISGRYNDSIEKNEKVKKAKIQKQAKLSSFFIVTPKEEQGPFQKEALVSISSDVEETVLKDTIERRETSANAWKALLRGPPDAPKCNVHGEAAVLRTVMKKGKNMGRQFWSCSRGMGRADDVQARCEFFKWLKS